jgi:predicted RNA polymerase sigma factor
MAEGPEAALAIVDRLVHEPALKNYHLLGSVRGDLLQKNSAATPKRAPHSKRQQRWRATSANRSC